MEEKRQPGRPKKRKLVSIETMQTMIREKKIQNGVVESDVKVPAVKTIYNKIWRKVVRNYGSKEQVLLDIDDLEKLCS